jgi:hypothetical protein
VQHSTCCLHSHSFWLCGARYARNDVARNYSTVSASGQEIALGASHGMVILFDIRVALSVSNGDVVEFLQNVYCSRPAAAAFWLWERWSVLLDLQHDGCCMLAIVHLDIDHHCLEFLF